MFKRRLWVLACLLYWLLIAIVSLLPPTKLPISPASHDKLWHAAAYAVGAVIVLPLWRSWSSLGRAGLGMIVFGVVMEALQGLTTYRSMEIMDALANSLGVVSGLLLGFTPLRGRLQPGT